MSQKGFEILDNDVVDEEVSAIMVERCDSEVKLINTGFVVSGEASESEEEEINTERRISSSNTRKFHKIVLQSVAPEEAIDLNVPEKREPIKYNSLLHKKLRERNANLYKNLTDLTNRPFHSAISGISNVTQQLIKTQILVQELSPLLRQMTNKLFYLEDKVDFLRDYTADLPNIEIKLK